MDIVGYIIAIFVLAIIDLLISCGNYKVWIREKELEQYLYEWKNSNKSKIWFIIWTCILCINLLIFILIPLLYQTQESMGFAFAISLIYTVGCILVCELVFWYVRYFYEKTEREEDPHDQEKKE